MIHEEVKVQVAIANRILAETGLAAGPFISIGHSSMRVPEDPELFVVKGRGYEMDALSWMRPIDMVVCDLNGFKVEGPPGIFQCHEVQMHACIYRALPEVQSVTHVHPQFAVLLSTLDLHILPMSQQGARVLPDLLPVYPHVRGVLTEDEGKDLANLLGTSPGILLKGHGITTVGASLENSVMRAVWIEDQARMNWYACCAVGPGYQGLSKALLEEMVERVPTAELPHFKDSMNGKRARTGSDAGTWGYYTDLVSDPMSSGGDVAEK